MEPSQAQASGQFVELRLNPWGQKRRQRPQAQRLLFGRIAWKKLRGRSRREFAGAAGQLVLRLDLHRSRKFRLARFYATRETEPALRQCQVVRWRSEWEMKMFHWRDPPKAGQQSQANAKQYRSEGSSPSRRPARAPASGDWRKDAEAQARRLAPDEEPAAAGAPSPGLTEPEVDKVRKAAVAPTLKTISLVTQTWINRAHAANKQSISSIPN